MVSLQQRGRALRPLHFIPCTGGKAARCNKYLMKMKLKTCILAALLLMGAGTMSAQTENGFQEVDVMQDLNINPFRFFNQPLVLCAGDKKESNAMTIGWGALGNLWGMSRPVATVYVAEKRYTKTLLDKHPTFTIMYFKDDHVNEYLGSASGRDGDKAKALGLHVAYTKHGTPYYKEAEMVIECEIMYAAPFDPQHFRNNVPKDQYANFPAGLHTEYIADITGMWQK